MTWPPGIGGVLAILVLVLAVVFAAIGKMDPVLAALLAGLAIARLT